VVKDLYDIDFIKKTIEPFKQWITNDEYNKYIELTFKSHQDGISYNESRELDDIIFNKIFNNIHLTDKHLLKQFDELIHLMNCRIVYFNKLENK
jgi:hypothetical protein